jgi:dienelactone hydrolase
VAAGGVGMLGWSRGSEAALLTASRNPAVRAVVAVAPSSAVWQGLNFISSSPPQPAWTLRGKPLPSVVPNAAAYQPNDSLLQMFQQSFATLDARADAALPVEQISGGILLISGGSDNIWPATRYGDRIVARLQARQFRGAFEHLDYPAAGHVVFVGDPSDPAARGLGAPNPMMGGTAAGNEAAWQDNWPRTVGFLRAQLKAGAR